MQADFAAAWQALLGNEGGYADNPADPGGATMYGVTERAARAHGYTGPMQALPLETAQNIAKTEYWDPYHCDQMPQEVAFQVLDTAYNGGHPAEWVQQAVGVTADGIIGPQTLAAINAADPDKIVMRFNGARIDYYTELGAWPTFGRGWMHRIANNLRRAAS